MQHKQSFLFLAALGVATLAACDKPAIPAANAAISIVAEKKAEVGLSATSAKAGAAKPGAKALSTKEGLALAQKSNCLACHSIEKKIIGPAWMDVSKRYKDEKGIEDRLVVKVSTGGYGNWGNMPMPALAPDVKEKDIRVLVRFVLSLAQ